MASVWTEIWDLRRGWQAGGVFETEGFIEGAHANTDADRVDAERDAKVVSTRLEVSYVVDVLIGTVDGRTIGYTRTSFRRSDLNMTGGQLVESL